MKLRKNEKSRTVAAWFGGRLYEFTAVKENISGGQKKIVFIISPKQRTSKEHLLIYSLRWCIEKFFRSSKQSLGLEDCQAQKHDGIINRILAVMIAFTAIEETRFVKKRNLLSMF